MSVPRRFWGLAALAAAPAFFTGCSSFLQQPANVEATRLDVEAIRREQTELKALVLELRQRMESQSEAVTAIRADTNLELRQINERLEVLTARLDEIGNRQERARRTSPVPPPALPAPVDTVRGPTGAASPVPGAGDPGQILDAATRDFTRGNYQLAKAGFDEVIAAEPRGELADDAQFMKGECLYSLGEVDEAIQEYLRVRDVYSDGDKVAAATFKIGVAFERKGDAATARRYYETAIREFPGTPESELAKERLKNLP